MTNKELQSALKGRMQAAEREAIEASKRAHENFKRAEAAEAALTAAQAQVQALEQRLVVAEAKAQLAVRYARSLRFRARIAGDRNSPNRLSLSEESWLGDYDALAGQEEG